MEEEDKVDDYEADTWESSSMTNENDTHQHHHGPKTGRRGKFNALALTIISEISEFVADTIAFDSGDPRMHRAVAARLANPAISLYEALKIGGFEYPTDDDSSCLDSEQVSLGQRKNQLSRRVRLAKKNGGTTTVALDVPSNKIHVPNGVVSSSGVQNQLAGTKRSLLDEEDVLSAGGEEPEEGTEQQTLMAKFHPQYHPILVQPPSRPPPAARANTMVVNNTSGSNVTINPANLPAGMPLLQGQMDSLITKPGPQNSNMVTNVVTNPSSSGSLQTMGGGAPVASGVAVASLSQTAANVGMTLEQLAWALQTHTTLAQVMLSGPTQFQTPKDLALVFFENECKTLYQKVMLQSGFSPAEAQPGSKTHLEFAWEAWQAEGQRLRQQILGKADVGDAPLEAKTDSPARLPCQSSATASEQQHSQALSGQAHVHSSSHDHGCGLDGGRHIHRLEGKCGHKAILHQPPNGNAHIDFVIGNQVECYHGVKPIVPQDSSNGGIWPSRYKCQDLSCSDNYCTEMACDHKNTKECPPAVDPKTVDMNDIDFDGKEWNSDFTNDASLAGLFKLGGTPGPQDEEDGRET